MKNQAANNGTFIPKPGFTVVQNSVARDWNLSSGALGLYTHEIAFVGKLCHLQAQHNQRYYRAIQGGQKCLRITLT